MKPYARLAIVLFLILVAVSAPATKSRSPEPLDPQRLAWTSLDFKARKLFITARTVVRLRGVPAAEAGGEWINSSRGAVAMPEGDTVMEVGIDTAAAGRESAVNVWFDPRQATALQRLKVRKGKKAYRKVSRFTDEGTYVLRTAPIDKGEAGRPFSEWTKIEEYFYPLPEEIECRTVSEPSALFYILSAVPLSPGQPRRLCVFSGKKTIPVAVELLGTEDLEVDYTEKSASQTKRRRGEVETWKVAVRPLADGEEFELLGLEGEIEVSLEKEHRIPLEVRGRIGGLGKVAVRLTAVELGRP